VEAFGTSARKSCESKDRLKLHKEGYRNTFGARNPSKGSLIRLLRRGTR